MVVRHTTTAGGVGVPQPPNKKRRLSRKTSCPNDYLVNSLFRRYSQESEHTTAGLHPVSIPDDLSVFHEVRQSRTVVDGKYPSWPAHLKQLAVGLLAIYRHRKVDFSIREEVMLLHIAETSDRMRAQQGQCYGFVPRYREPGNTATGPLLHEATGRHSEVLAGPEGVPFRGSSPRAYQPGFRTAVFARQP